MIGMGEGRANVCEPNNNAVLTMAFVDPSIVMVVSKKSFFKIHTRNRANKITGTGTHEARASAMDREGRRRAFGVCIDILLIKPNFHNII